MRLVSRASEIDSAWRDAGSEATNAFGDGRLYIEKYLEHPRHIEIQILADTHGNIVYLAERECSVQRRHQKVIEEAPSPVMVPELRRKMGNAAVNLAREAGYTNAGTVEFLVDADRNFYFLEVNTRLQVEHPVTEMVSGLDLVQLQIRIAAGERLTFAWQELHPRGHAIECRIYAEDPENNFFPSPGKILARRTPSGPGVRMDEGVYPGFVVPMDYDPLLGKLIVWASTREEAIARMSRALDEYYVSGIKTNVDLFRRILADPAFVRAEFHTRWLDDWLQKEFKAAPAHDDGADDASTTDAALLGALAWHLAQNARRFRARNLRLPTRPLHAGNFRDAKSKSRDSQRNDHPMKLEIRIGATRANAPHGANAAIPAQNIDVTRDGNRIRVNMDGRIIEGDAVEVATGTYSVLIGGHSYEVRVEPAHGGLRVHAGAQEYRCGY